MSEENTTATMNTETNDMNTDTNTMMGGKKKSNGHKMSCRCPICRNMMKKSKGKSKIGGKKSKKTKKSKKSRKHRRSRKH